MERQDDLELVKVVNARSGEEPIPVCLHKL